MDRIKKARFRQVGTRPDRPDGVDKVTGRAHVWCRHGGTGHADGLHPAQPACPCADHVDRCFCGQGAGGVKAVVTCADLSPDDAFMRDLQENSLAGDKALYDGHAVAAVAAIDAAVAKAALKAIKVDYEACRM